MVFWSLRDKEFIGIVTVIIVIVVVISGVVNEGCFCFVGQNSC